MKDIKSFDLSIATPIDDASLLMVVGGGMEARGPGQTKTSNCEVYTAEKCNKCEQCDKCYICS